MLGWIRSLARNVFQRARMERELDYEIGSYVELLTDEKIAHGMTPRQARREALIELGGVAQVKEQVRDIRTGALLDSLALDLRQALRTLAGGRGLSAIALASLALGVGSAAAMFTLVNGALLRPLPYAHADRLVRVTDSYPKGAILAMQQASRTMDFAGFTTDSEFNLRVGGQTAHVAGSVVSANLFRLLGTGAQLGRTLEAGDERPSCDRVAILSDALWRGAFHGDPSMVGRPVAIDGVERVVVGIMPADFSFPIPAAQLWVPARLDPGDWVDTWGAGFVPVIARLRPGATLAQAREELPRLVSHAITQFPYSMAANWNADAGVVPLRQAMVGDVARELAVLACAVAMVLLIGCVNVASLLLSRVAVRRKELAVRASLGATRWRLIRQLLTESLMLAVAGGGFGLVLASAIISWLGAALPSGAPHPAITGIDSHVVMFVMAAAILTGILCGLAPAFGLSRMNLTEAVNAGGPRVTAHGETLLRRALIAGEVAMTAVLVIGAGLLIRSLWLFTQVNPGFRAEQLVTARVYPDQASCGNPEKCAAFYGGLLQQARAITGVGEVAAVNALPYSGEVAAIPAEIEGHPLAPAEHVAPILWAGAATPGYFRIMGIPMLAGRAFDSADGLAAPGVVIVSEATARRFWPGLDPLGKHLKPVWDTGWRQVVGVVGDVEGLATTGDASGAIYMPYPQSVGLNRRIPAAMSVVLRTSADPARVAGELRRLVRNANPGIAVGEARTMEAVASSSAAQPRSMMWLFAGFAAAALLLVATGIYGLISYSVAQRKHEIGIRLALGAARIEVFSFVLGRSMKCVLAGLAVGLAASLALTRLMADFLYHVAPADPVTYLAVAVVVTGVALVAGYVASRRAIQQNPAVALRVE